MVDPRHYPEINQVSQSTRNSNPVAGRKSLERKTEKVTRKYSLFIR
jgi:hypothetical protein